MTDDLEDAGELADDAGYNPIFNDLVQEALKTGLRSVIQAVMEVEEHSGSRLGSDIPKFRTTFIDETFLTLVLLPTGVLQDICGGNLNRTIVAARAAFDSQATADTPLMRFKAEMGRLTHRAAKEHPQIYIRNLVSFAVDENGDRYHHMTAGRILEICSELELYILPAAGRNHWKKCYEYDTAFDGDDDGDSAWSKADSKEGFRRWLCKKDISGYMPVPSRYRQVQVFIAAVRERVANMMANHPDSSPVYVPMVYIGYALDNESRKMQHNAYNDQSNWLANAFLAIAKIHWLDEKYTFTHWAICPLARERQASIAEMVLARLTNAYYHNGGGFNIALAGQTNSIKATELKWREHHEWLVKKWDFDDRVRHQSHLIASWQKEQDQQTREINDQQVQEEERRIKEITEELRELLRRGECGKDSSVYYSLSCADNFAAVKSANDEVQELCIR